MKVYDDKTKGISKNDKYFVISNIDEKNSVTFKTSYIVLSELRTQGKITALFDLVVLGDIDASEIDVKGQLICLGTCNVGGIVTVQNDVWVNEIIADSVVSHGQITAQNIDTKELDVDGSIVVGKTFSIESLAQIGNSLLCGETAFGAGHIVADHILTVEPLDLDEGIEAIEDPNEYHAQKSAGDSRNAYIKKGTEKYEPRNDYEGYIAFLMETISSKEEKTKLNDWLDVLYSAEKMAGEEFKNCYSGSLLIKLIEIQESEYFSNWKIIISWATMLKKHFENVLKGTEKKYKTVQCNFLKTGDDVFHKKYGKGRVKNIHKDAQNNYAEVMFYAPDGNYIKKFIVPECYKFFEKIEEIEVGETSKVERIECEIVSYSEWLTALTVINRNKKYMEEAVYSALFDRLMAYVGLKAKFMNDRFKEKGWN